MRRAYAAPLIAGFFLFALLVGWSVQERKRIQEQARSKLRAYARAVAGALQGSVQTDVRGGGLRRGRVSHILSRVVDATDVTFLRIRQGERLLLQAGRLPAGLSIQSASGEELREDVFVYWHTIRLQDCPRGGGHGDGRGCRGGAPGENDVDLGSESQLLVLAVDATRFAADAHRALQRLVLTVGVAAVALVVLALAWGGSVRAGRLHEQLQAARAHADHLEELNLSATGLAHETRNPLGAIRGMAQRLAADALNDEQRRKALAIVEEADVASTRLSDFLRFAKSRTPEIHSVNARAACQRVVDLLVVESEAQNVTLTVDCGDVAILADPTMLDQVLMNLLLNSLQASTTGGDVTVRCTSEEEQATLLVQDSGCGIEETLMPEIFKPYVSGREEGHGIGLAVVKRIADAHGWQISAESAPATRTTVTISGIGVA